MENDPSLLEWNMKRSISKRNYKMHTDAIKNANALYILNNNAAQQLSYASEADLLNILIWGTEAKEWRLANPELAASGKTLRDVGSINDLIILGNLEAINSVMLKNGMDRTSRFKSLKQIVIDERESLGSGDGLKSFPKPKLKKLLSDSI